MPLDVRFIAIPAALHRWRQRYFAPFLRVDVDMIRLYLGWLRWNSGNSTIRRYTHAARRLLRSNVRTPARTPTSRQDNEKTGMANKWIHVYSVSSNNSKHNVYIA